MKASSISLTRPTRRASSLREAASLRFCFCAGRGAEMTSQNRKNMQNRFINQHVSMAQSRLCMRYAPTPTSRAERNARAPIVPVVPVPFETALVPPTPSVPPSPLSDPEFFTCKPQVYQSADNLPATVVSNNASGKPIRPPPSTLLPSSSCRLPFRPQHSQSFPQQPACLRRSDL